MTTFKVQDAASHRLDEIFEYTLETWGVAQAVAYVSGLFDRFAAIAARRTPWRRIPADFAVDGYMCRHERHFVYWRVLSDGAVGIVTLLHERMHQIERLREDVEP